MITSLSPHPKLVPYLMFRAVKILKAFASSITLFRYLSSSFFLPPLVFLAFFLHPVCVADVLLMFYINNNSNCNCCAIMKLRHPSWKHVLPRFSWDAALMICFSTLQDLKCFVFSLIGLHFKIKPI